MALEGLLLQNISRLVKSWCAVEDLITYLSKAFGLTPPDQVQRRNPDLTAVLARSLSDRQLVLRCCCSQLVIVLVEIKVRHRGRSRKVVFMVANEHHPAGNLVSVDINLQNWFGQNLWMNRTLFADWNSWICMFACGGKLTSNPHQSVDWYYRVCLTLHVPGSPAGVHPLVFKGQVGKEELGVVALVSHHLHPISVENHLRNRAFSSHKTRDLQTVSHEGRLRCHMSDSPTSWTMGEKRARRHWIQLPGVIFLSFGWCQRKGKWVLNPVLLRLADLLRIHHDWFIITFYSVWNHENYF